MKGLICAGGTATRLEELTRVTNKHLLPVGRWPMVYYPLQLLERLGVREGLLVTGQQHAGQFIDLLGNGHVRSRSGDDPLFDLDLSYKVQVEAGGIAQVVGMARDFAAGDQLVVCLGDNIFEHAHADVVAFVAWRCHGVREGLPGPGELRRRGLRRGGEASWTSSRRPAASTRDTQRRRRTTRSSGSTATRPTCSRSSRGSRPSSRGELEITDVNRVYAQRGDLEVHRVEGWWHDGGKHWADLAELGRLIEETGANK